MSCDRNPDELVAYLYGELSEEEIRDLEAHLPSCADCRGGLEEMQKARGQLRRWQPPAASPDLFERLENRIELLRAKHQRDQKISLNIQFIIGLAALVFFAILIMMAARDGQQLFASPIEVVKKSFQVTMFNQDLALVKDTRLILNLKRGENIVRFREVPARILPDSVRFRSITAPRACRVLEQNYEYNLASAQAILDKYLDEKITCVLKDGSEFPGFLKAYDFSSGRSRQLRQLTISEEAGGEKTRIIPGSEIESIRFATIPEGLLSKPTLVWKLEVRGAMKHEVEVAYLTKGMDWQAHYRAQVKPGDKIDLEGWVTANNRSGATFEEAGLKLLAGDVHIVQPPTIRLIDSDDLILLHMMSVRSEKPQFVEKPLFEYHLYTLTRPTTLKDRQTKQIMFIHPTLDIPCKRTYIYRGANVSGRYGREDPRRGTECNTRVAVMFEFENSRDNNLGIPLPMGIVRLYKNDLEGESQFIGEDAIEHTPREEKVELYIGSAFDVTGSRRQTNFETDSGLGYAEESFEIKLHNARSQPITVKVVETMYRWANWKVVKSSHEFTKVDAKTIEFSLDVGPQGVATLTYTVVYTKSARGMTERTDTMHMQLKKLMMAKVQLEAKASAMMREGRSSDRARKELARLKAIDAEIEELEAQLRKLEGIY